MPLTDLDKFLLMLDLIDHDFQAVHHPVMGTIVFVGKACYTFDERGKLIVPKEQPR